MEVAEDNLETEAVSPEASDDNELPSEQQQHKNQEILEDKKAVEPFTRHKRKKRSSSCDNNSSGALVADYVSDVSSEDFSGPEDGECESDGGADPKGSIRHHPAVVTSSPLQQQQPKQQQQQQPPPRRVVLPPEPVVRSVSVGQTLIENASPIEDEDDLDDLSKFPLTSLMTIHN